MGQESSRRLGDRPIRVACGQITKVIPGTYVMTVNVKSDARPEARCLYAPAMMAPLFGAKSCDMPVEGTSVVLLVLPDDPETYVAICCLPESTQGYKDLPAIVNAAMYGSSPEAGVSYWNVDSYHKAGEDKTKLNFRPSPSDRPWSTLPGEWAQANTMGCLVGLFHFMATLKATERAKLECFIFDDLVRLTSGQFQHNHAFGSTGIWDDSGYVDWELSGSHFAPEVRGYQDFTKMAIDKGDKPGSKTATEERWAPANYDAVGKKRFHLMVGALGDMLQLYLRNGQDGLNPELVSSQLDYSAFCKLHMDNSGAVNLQSSAGIGFELNDRIPIPKRLKEPGDPEGDKVTKDTFKKKEHYRYNDETADKYPWMRNIRAIDADLWERGLAYQRYDELKKDFYVPEEADITAPQDIYDKLGSTTQHSKYPRRRGGCKIEEDGSARIWDSFGGEIFMRGGDIVIACPGHVIMQPGKGVVMLGNNIIIKAKTGVDISAEDRDVTVAGNNIKLFARTNLLAEAGEVMVLTAKYMLARAVEGINMMADWLAIKMAGAVRVATANIYMAASSMFAAETGGKAAVILSRDSAYLIGEAVTLAGDKSTTITRDRDMLVPLMWAPIRVSIYDQLAKLPQQLDETYEGKLWFAPFTAENLAAMDDYRVKFRSSAEFGTATGIETYMAAPEFKLYQTRWQTLGYMGCEFIQASAVEWKEKAVNGTYPWPGTDARSGAYATLPDPVNTGDGVLSKARSALSGEFTASVASESMDKYIICN